MKKIDEILRDVDPDKQKETIDELCKHKDLKNINFRKALTGTMLPTSRNSTPYNSMLEIHPYLKNALFKTLIELKEEDAIDEIENFWMTASFSFKQGKKIGLLDAKDFRDKFLDLDEKMKNKFWELYKKALRKDGEFSYLNEMEKFNFRKSNEIAFLKDEWVKNKIREDKDFASILMLNKKIQTKWNLEDDCMMELRDSLECSNSEYNQTLAHLMIASSWGRTLPMPVRPSDSGFERSEVVTRKIMDGLLVNEITEITEQGFHTYVEAYGEKHKVILVCYTDNIPKETKALLIRKLLKVNKEKGIEPVIEMDNAQLKLDTKIKLKGKLNG